MYLCINPFIPIFLIAMVTTHLSITLNRPNKNMF